MEDLRHTKKNEGQMEEEVYSSARFPIEGET